MHELPSLPPVETTWQWSKAIVPAASSLLVALVMLVINHFREGSKQYSNRIKTLEIQATNHENRFTQFQLERENLVEKFDRRISFTEQKLDKVDQLSQDVARLSQEVSHVTKALDKLDGKFDKLLEALNFRTK